MVIVTSFPQACCCCHCCYCLSECKRIIKEYLFSGCIFLCGLGSALLDLITVDQDYLFSIIQPTYAFFFLVFFSLGAEYGNNLDFFFFFFSLINVMFVNRVDYQEHAPKWSPIKPLLELKKLISYRGQYANSREVILCL